MTTSLADDMVQFATRLAVNYPTLAFAPGGRAYGYAESVLSAVNDAKYLIDQFAPNLSILTAAGTFLDALGANYGLSRFQGSPAQALLQFSIPSPATSVQVIDIGTAGATPGDAATDSVGFVTTSAVAISVGQTLAGAVIGPIVPVVGTSVSTGLAGNVLPSGTQVTLSAALWTITATGSGAFTLSVTPQFGSLAVVATGLTTGTIYDSITAVPGVAFQVVGTLTPGNSATFTTGATLVAAMQNSPLDPTTNAISGSDGNVAVDAITTLTNTSVIGLEVTNPTAVDGTGGTILGMNPWSDAQYRQQLSVLLFPKYSVSQAEAAILSVPTVFDGLLVDPQDNTGNVTYYWCDVNGNQPGLTYPGSVPTIVPGSTAALVDAALRAVLPVGITPIPAAFTVTNLTSSAAIAITYSADASQLSTTIGPQIQTIVSAYVQGLSHGETPTAFGMISALAAAGVSLSDFLLTTSFSGAANTQIYRSTGAPSTVVSLTRA